MKLCKVQILISLAHILGFPGSSSGKESTCNVGDLGLVPDLGRSPGEGNGNPLQYSCLENSMDGGAWQATVLGLAKSWTRLSNFTLTFKGYGVISSAILQALFSAVVSKPILQTHQNNPGSLKNLIVLVSSTPAPRRAGSWRTVFLLPPVGSPAS